MLLALLVAMSLSGCAANSAWDGSIENLLRSQPERFGTVLADPQRYRVQVLYTQIDRDADNRPQFRSYSWRLDADEYFYPASTVKLPVAVLALEKLRALNIAGLDRDTPMFTGGANDGRSVGRYVREVLLVSDNAAFNRLYEFVGQQAINERLQALGLDGARIMHRLETVLSVEDNRHTPALEFRDGETLVYAQPAAYSAVDYTAAEPIALGKAEIVAGERLERPKDFANKNAWPLQAQHDLLRSLMFADAAGDTLRAGLSDDDYAFLYRNLSGYPTDSGIEAYADAGRYPEGYVKFFLYGGEAAEIPDNIRIFNKVGDAYGFMTDTAYVVDFDSGVEFLLAATLFTNANETFNDDTYEYDEIALPFLRDLGLAIYELELARERPYRADFSRLRGLLE